MKRIHIFKAGKHTDSHGTIINFTDAMLTQIATGYNPAQHEAPITVGHPKDNAPAYGWVQSCNFSDSNLFVVPHNVDADFSELVAAGKYKKVSASIYLPDSPSNPTPGKYALRHVGFLGAQPPAIKGLKAIDYKDAEEGVINFDEIAYSTWTAGTLASLFRRLRDALIADKGIEAADKTLPVWEIESLRPEMQPEAVPATSYTESPPTEGAPTVTEAEKLAALQPIADRATAQTAEFAERETALDTKTAEIATREAALAAKEAGVARKTTVDYVEGLVAKGQLLPIQKAAIVEALIACDGKAPVDFVEGDKTVNKTPRAALEAALQAMPKIVEFRELAKPRASAAQGAATVRIPADYTAEPERAALHQQALEYAEQNKCDYFTAVKAVESAA